MTRPVVENPLFASDWESIGPTKLAEKHKVSLRSVHSRRKAVEAWLGRPLVSPLGPGSVRRVPGAGSHRLEWKIPDGGKVIVGGDAHVWPGKPTPAMRAFVKFIKDMEPAGVILNGDFHDGASISRHARIGWESSPTIKQEIEALQDWLNAVTLAAPKKTKIAWPAGNHDLRFESKAASQIPEFAGVKGIHLKDHFSNRLTPCWDVLINDNTVVKHRTGRSGDHAEWNNVIRSGLNFVTNHTHAAKVVPYSDFSPVNEGTRYGVNTGCLADPYGPQFRPYSENNFRNHRSGFAVLTYRNGTLMLPELVLVYGDNHVQFRGDIIRV